MTSPYVHRGLSNGSPYYYVVTAVNTYGESGRSQEVKAIPHTDMDNSFHRIVWVQDMGEGRDPSAKGSNLRLMGMDSREGQVERVDIGSVGELYEAADHAARGSSGLYGSSAEESVYCKLEWIRIAGIVRWDRISRMERSS